MIDESVPGVAVPGTGWFVGREGELARLREAADQVRTGALRLILIEGEAGIGKTSLVRRLLAELDDFTALRAMCDRSELEFPYAVTAQLIARLPTEQLSSYGLLSAGPPQGVAPFQVGVELLRLLGELQAAGPIALVVDDVQWADWPSILALGSMLRRLWADHVLVVLVARTHVRSEIKREERATEALTDGQDDWRRIFAGRDGSYEVRLGGLTVANVRQLAAHMATPMELVAAERLWEHTGGHPLFVRTLLTELPGHALADRGRPFPVPDSLAGVVRRRLADLPQESLRLLEAVAVLDARCPLGMVASVAGVHNATAALAPLLTGELAQWWPGEPSSPVQIPHPLLRDAVYGTLTPQRRRELHAAAAPLVDGAAVWRHRVAATARTDPQLAAELEQAATEAVEAGNFPGVATYLLWAADLSDTREERERRRLFAVAHLLVSQDFPGAQSLREVVERCAPSAVRTAVLGGLDLISGSFAAGETQLSEAFAALREAPESAQMLAMVAAGLASLHAWQGNGEASLRFAQLGLSIRKPDPHVEALCTALSGLARLQTDGPGAGLRQLSEVTRLPTSPVATSPRDAYALMWRGAFHLSAGHATRATDDLLVALRLAKVSTVTEVGAGTHTWLANAQYQLGAWDDAAINAEHAVSIAEAEERWWLSAFANATASFIAAGRGDWGHAEKAAQAASNWVELLGPPQYAVYPAMAWATLAQAQDDHQEMYAALAPITELPWNTGWPLAFRPSLLPLLTEALIGTHRLDQAADVLDELHGCAQVTPSLVIVTEWLRGWLARERGDHNSARAVLEAAVALPDGENDVPLHRGMLEQSFGDLLLTLHERRAAIHWIRQAHDRFAALGALPFRDRCAARLEACGVRPPEQAADQILVLTSRERDVARLIARGATNQQAAGQLYVSVKTVEYHLHNIYTKLGINSRSQLAALLSRTRR